MSEWREAPYEVISIAEDLIRNYHIALLEGNIAFVMKSEEHFKLKSHQILA